MQNWSKITIFKILRHRSFYKNFRKLHIMKKISSPKLISSKVEILFFVVIFTFLDSRIVRTTENNVLCFCWVDQAEINILYMTTMKKSLWSERHFVHPHHPVLKKKTRARKRGKEMKHDKSKKMPTVMRQ